MTKFKVSVSETGCGAMISTYEAETKLEAMKEAIDLYRWLYCCEEDVPLTATAKVVR
jgi:hypothetical protein